MNTAQAEQHLAADTTSTEGTVAITGSTGLVGRALTDSFRQDNWNIIEMVRRQPTSFQTQVRWDTDHGIVNPPRLNGTDVFVHLAGENIAGGRWNERRKARIRASRVLGTRSISESLASLDRPPKTFICASAVGFYGDRRDEILKEDSQPGRGFLADVCQEWENACQPAVAAGIRVVNLRIGMVVSRHGGALDAMLLPFKLGLGGKVGSGNQYWSWVALDDLVGIIRHAIKTESLSGPVNAVAPCPVTNRDFTRALGAALDRPTVMPMPAFAARLAIGEMAPALLIASQRVIPERLNETGYPFQFSSIDACLQHELNGSEPDKNSH